MQFLSFALAALLTVPAHAFIAWSGTACNDAVGDNVACDGSCVPFHDRHSFIADTDGSFGVHCVAFYVDPDCSGQRFNFTEQRQQCTAVDTGTDIESFRCFSGTDCV
ncbi:hypothetical protein AURDEDRAFT_163913 [Auricularia subglabra TFB-10046 SS5]|nr:hypothetical protein AURDEDRAFT_163913 [Auricularia subglabra TFB-10046 SS5]